MGAQCTCSPSESSEILIEPGAGTSTASKEQIKLAKPKIPEPNRFDENYQLEDGPDGSEGVLGYSSIGTVVKTRHKGSSKVHAVKQISKSKIDGDEWKGDVQAFKTLDHPNICKVHDTWEDAMNIYLVMEFCKGGQLTNLGAAEQNKVNEHAVAVLVRQMVDAVSHLHEHKMVHSDIRPENWLFEDQISDDNSGNRASVLDTQLKMVDFGFANKYGKIRSGQGQRFPSGCQAHLRGKTSRAIQEDRSLFCKAPEQVGIISGGRGSSDEVEKADVWALGIIAYFLLSGQPPFTGPPEKDALFKSASFVFMPAELWRPVSSEAKKLHCNVFAGVGLRSTQGRQDAEPPLDGSREAGAGRGGRIEADREVAPCNWLQSDYQAVDPGSILAFGRESEGILFAHEPAQCVGEGCGHRCCAQATGA